MTHAFATPGNHMASATATDELGLASTQTATVMVIGPPTISDAALALHQPNAKHGKAKAKAFSAALSFSLDQNATVDATITRALSGKRKHGRCEAAREAGHHAACPTSKQIESFTISGQSGANSFTFPSGTAAKHLSAGSYTLMLVATGAGEQKSQSVSLKFAVK